MSKTAVVYTLPDCPRCSHAKNALEALGYRVEERDADGLVRGDIHDSEALAEMTMNDGAVPVVVVDGRALRRGDAVYNLIQEHKEW